MRFNAARKWVPGVTLLGALLVVIAAALHPLTVNPWNADIPIHYISEKKSQWMWDHSLMAAAILLWLGGLAACFSLFSPGHPLYAVVIALFISSMGMWLVTLSFELGGMPISVEWVKSHSDSVHRSLAESLFAGALISGYFSMIPAWLAVMMGARTKWGMLSGVIGLAGIVYCLISPSIWILLVTSAFPYAWTLIYAWHCWKHA